MDLELWNQAMSEISHKFDEHQKWLQRLEKHFSRDKINGMTPDDGKKPDQPILFEAGWPTKDLKL